MTYYKTRKHLIMDIEGLITKNKGKKIPLATVFYMFAKRYGFSERIVIKFLKYHENNGDVLIKDDVLYITGGKNDGKDSNQKK